MDKDSVRYPGGDALYKGDIALIFTVFRLWIGRKQYRNEAVCGYLLELALNFGDLCLDFFQFLIDNSL
jgi:hypothetical protein